MYFPTIVFFSVIVSFCFFKQKTAYEMRISDWSSDVCSSDLLRLVRDAFEDIFLQPARIEIGQAFIDADRQDVRNGKNIMPLEIAEMFGFRNTPDDGRVRPRYAPQIQMQDDHDASNHTALHDCQPVDNDRDRNSTRMHPSH